MGTVSFFFMAKSKNHTNHNQNRKAQRNGIKKLKQYKYKPNKGMEIKFYRNQRYANKARSQKIALEWEKRVYFIKDIVVKSKVFNLFKIFQKNLSKNSNSESYKRKFTGLLNKKEIDEIIGEY